MIHLQTASVNEEAYRRLRATLKQTYPAGHFVAIDEGRIVADAPTFEQLDHTLTAAGRTSRDILVVQVGMEDFDFGWILLGGNGQ